MVRVGTTVLNEYQSVLLSLLGLNDAYLRRPVDKPNVSADFAEIDNSNCSLQ